MQIVNVYCRFNTTNEDSGLLWNEAESMGECSPTFRRTHQPLKTKEHTERQCVTPLKTRVLVETGHTPIPHTDRLMPHIHVNDTGLWSGPVSQGNQTVVTSANFGTVWYICWHRRTHTHTHTHTYIYIYIYIMHWFTQHPAYNVRYSAVRINSTVSYSNTPRL